MDSGHRRRKLLDGPATTTASPLFCACGLPICLACPLLSTFGSFKTSLVSYVTSLRNMLWLNAVSYVLQHSPDPLVDGEGLTAPFLKPHICLSPLLLPSATYESGCGFSELRLLVGCWWVGWRSGKTSLL